MKSILSLTRDEIAQRAHDIWEQAGRPDGQEVEHWLRAERELRQEREQAEQLRGGASSSRSPFIDTYGSSGAGTPQRNPERLGTSGR